MLTTLTPAELATANALAAYPKCAVRPDGVDPVVFVREFDKFWVFAGKRHASVLADLIEAFMPGNDALALDQAAKVMRARAERAEWRAVRAIKYADTYIGELSDEPNPFYRATERESLAWRCRFFNMIGRVYMFSCALRYKALGYSPAAARRCTFDRMVEIILAFDMQFNLRIPPRSFPEELEVMPVQLASEPV